MDKVTIAKLLSIIVTIGGAVVMAGWILEIEVLITILPIWVTMKFSTALSFFVSGIILYFVTDANANDSSDLTHIILSSAVIIILLLMATPLLSTFLNIRTGIEDLFVKEAKDAVQTSTHGRPSIGTMVNFILVALTGIITMYELKNLDRKLFIFGLIITIIGIIAIVGYVFSIPLLYFSFEDYSTAMAIHTAILFIILGIGFLLQRKSFENGN